MAIESEPAIMNSISSWIGSVGITTIFAMIGMAVLNTFFPKLLDYQWSKRLEAAKSELAREASRLYKVHTKQFDVLSDLWAKANYAYGAIQHCAAPGMVVSILNRSKEDQIEIMKYEEYSQEQIDRILNSPKPENAFQKEQTVIRFNRANKTFKDFSNEYFIQELFLTDEIAKEFENMRGTLSDLLIKASVKQNSASIDANLVQEIQGELSKMKERFDDLKKPIAKYLGVDRA